MATEREKLRDLIYDWKLGRNKLSPGDVMAAIDAYAANYTPKPTVPGDGELREKVHDELAKCAISYAKYGGGGQYFYDYADAIMQLFASQTAAAQEQMTGQEWYDRFIKELPEPYHTPRELCPNINETVEQRHASIGEKTMHHRAVTAARKASGIEQ